MWKQFNKALMGSAVALAIFAIVCVVGLYCKFFTKETKHALHVSQLSKGE